jgi:EpsI family protein
MNFLRSKYAKLLTLILLLQAGVYYAVAARHELTPNPIPLSFFPTHVGDWTMTHDYPMEPDIQEVLKADDTVTRDYVNMAHPALASLFVAFFKTQRYGQTPHSPKNCLPGQGWEPTENETETIAVTGRPEPIVANRYLVSRGEDKMLTIYWYQSHNRVIASEYSARFWLVMDAIRYRRSDTSLVRVMVRVNENDVDTANKTAVAFVQAVFPALLQQLPL